MTIEADFNRLFGICKALRLAEKGNRATGQKPDPTDAQRLRAALDYFIAEHDSAEREGCE